MSCPTAGPGVVFFTVPGDPAVYFARRLGKDYWAANRWRGFRLMGVNCKRLSPVLLAHDGRRVRVRLVAEPTEAAA